MGGLQGLDRRFVPYNGAFGAAQREWLHKECSGPERVIVASHIPIKPGSAVNSTLLCDYEEVLEQLTPNVVAVLSGHDHNGGYVHDEEKDIHFLTFPSPMVAPNKGHDLCHAILSVFEDRIEIDGFG